MNLGLERKIPQQQSAAALADQATRGKWVAPGICILLAAMVWAVFGQTLHYGYVNFDDNTYVYDTPIVLKGLTWEGIGWAFSHAQAGNWAPLTTISHMLDCQIYGTQPWGHHLTNVLLHGAAAVLLFLVLRQMTGALWRSAFVAAVFAIHPLRVESVAWVSERKDVLSGVFFMLTIAAYVHYTRKPGSLRRYLGAFILFALGLMSKSMIVTLPFVLLLLDYWPLGRLAQQPRAVPSITPDRFSIPWRLVLEKTPFFALSAAVCVTQVFTNQAGITPINKLPLLARIANMLVAYVAYLGEMIYPEGLSAMYPHPGTHLPVLEVLPAILLLASISTCVFVWRHKHPFLPVGWLWYLGMLVPAIGLIQAGVQAHADRFTYLPQIGIYLLVTWTVADLSAKLPLRHLALGGLSAITILALMLCAHTQTAYWRDSRTLWTRALAVTRDNAVACNNLGYTLLQEGEVDDAIIDFQKALEINPDIAEAHYNLGLAFEQKGRMTDAIGEFQKAIELKPDYAEAHYDLGLALQETGQPDQALAQYQMALEIVPDMPDAHLNLGNIFGQQGNMKEAIAQFQKVLEIKPDYAKAHFNLALAFQQDRQIDQAIGQYKTALEIQPGYPAALNNLAYVLAACPQASLRDGAKALELALQANQAAGGNNPTVLETLAAAYAENGRFSEAVETAQRALDLATSQSNKELTGELQSQIALYKAHTPFRDGSLGK